MLTLENCAVGYGGRPALSGLGGQVRPGRMTCILGPNGAGKTTLLKTMARILRPLEGRILLEDRPLDRWKAGELARCLAVVLTDQVEPEGATCFEVAALGRIPHTGFFGALSARDRELVESSLARCGAGHLAQKRFCHISSGERQKVLLARGLAQDPRLLVLDEPTSHLDIRFKLEILTVLKDLCAREGRTVLCTLHEPELALKICDDLMLVGGGGLVAFGPAGEMAASGALDSLYGLAPGQLDPAAGAVEFRSGPSRDFFLLGSDSTVPTLLRGACGAGLGFGAGLLWQNDVACHVALAMGAPVFTLIPGSAASGELCAQVEEAAAGYDAVILADPTQDPAAAANAALGSRLEQRGLQVLRAGGKGAAALLDGLLARP